jgi:hypothetical protein
MKNKTVIQEKILNQPSYWIERINAILYNAILNYMETNNLNRNELEEHLEVSREELSCRLLETD